MCSGKHTRGVRLRNREYGMGTPGQRAFRTADIYNAEFSIRSLLTAFLYARGFAEIGDNRVRYGRAVSQTVNATTRAGTNICQNIRHRQQA